ncbi:MAG: hypothetical protein F7C32_00845 [Desulfurococcales archaeon]|nr:hypothetical protein [Desulfurococcales archaeon]
MTKKDFLRNIVNTKLSVNSDRLPAALIEDLREEVGRAEEKYKFSVYGGDVKRLVDYLNSSDFEKIVMLARAHNALWIVREILEEAKKEYSGYPEIVNAINKRLENLEETIRTSRIDIDAVARMLKNAGFKAEVSGDEIRVKLYNGYAIIKATGLSLHYSISLEGRTIDPESILKKLNIIRTI